jgi:uncharacterized protein
MEGIAAGCDCNVDDSVGVQVTAHRVRAQVVGFIGFLDVQGMAVGIGVNCDRFNAHLGTSAHNPYRDFAAVGYQNFFDQEKLRTENGPGVPTGNLAERAFYVMGRGLSTLSFIAKTPGATVFDRSIRHLYDSRPMSAGLPIQIDPLDLAKNRIHLQGSYLPADLPRVMETVLAGSNAITVDLEFSTASESGTAMMSGKISGELITTCERCLEPFTLDLDISPRIFFCRRGKESAPAVDDDERDLIEVDGPVALRDLIEDEILLNLPMIPMHNPDQCNASRFIGNTGELEKPSDNPFKQLAELKKKR